LQKLPEEHWLSVLHSGRQVALMQWEAAPQSLSKVHCAVAGAASLQAPLTQAWPSGQLLLPVHTAWQPPVKHTRPVPHWKSAEQLDRPAAPQVGAPGL